MDMALPKPLWCDLQDQYQYHYHYLLIRLQSLFPKDQNMVHQNQNTDQDHQPQNGQYTKHQGDHHHHHQKGGHHHHQNTSQDHHHQSLNTSPSQLHQSHLTSQHHQNTSHHHQRSPSTAHHHQRCSHNTTQHLLQPLKQHQ